MHVHPLSAGNVTVPPLSVQPTWTVCRFLTISTHQLSLCVLESAAFHRLKSERCMVDTDSWNLTCGRTWVTSTFTHKIVPCEETLLTWDCENVVATLLFSAGVLFWIGIWKLKQMRRGAQSFPAQANWTKSITAFKSQTRYAAVKFTERTTCYVIFWFIGLFGIGKFSYNTLLLCFLCAYCPKFEHASHHLPPTKCSVAFGLSFSGFLKLTVVLTKHTFWTHFRGMIMTVEQGNFEVLKCHIKSTYLEGYGLYLYCKNRTHRNSILYFISSVYKWDPQKIPFKTAVTFQIHS